MKRFLKTLSLLLVVLLLLVSGVDSALDRLAADPVESSITFLNPRGDVMLTYSGNVAFSQGLAHPLRGQPRPGLIPRA